MDNLSITGNSLGSVYWQGDAEWNTGFGELSKFEQLDCGARFKFDINNYLNTSGSQYKAVQVCGHGCTTLHGVGLSPIFSVLCEFLLGHLKA